MFSLGVRFLLVEVGLIAVSLEAQMIDHGWQASYLGFWPLGLTSAADLLPRNQSAVVHNSSWISTSRSSSSGLSSSISSTALSPSTAKSTTSHGIGDFINAGLGAPLDPSASSSDGATPTEPPESTAQEDSFTTSISSTAAPIYGSTISGSSSLMKTSNSSSAYPLVILPTSSAAPTVIPLTSIGNNATSINGGTQYSYSSSPYSLPPYAVTSALSSNISTSLANSSSATVPRRLQEALSCLTASRDWSRGPGDWVTATSSVSYTKYTADVITCSESVPSVSGTLTSTGVGQTVLTQSHWMSLEGPWTQPAPNCTISPNECQAIISSSLDAANQAQSNCAIYTDEIMGTPTGPPPSEAPAPFPTGPVEPAQSDCYGGCTIFGGTVKLMYFPITAPPGPTPQPTCAFNSDMGTKCPGGYADSYGISCIFPLTNSSTPSGSRPSVVSGGHTFYKDRAYISFETAYASGPCGYVGSQYAAAIVPVASTELYSHTVDLVSAYPMLMTGWQFDFNQLTNVPVNDYATHTELCSSLPSLDN
ncbi:hypothetical protein LTS18_007137, partial [Coniosporium uncinatum]